MVGFNGGTTTTATARRLAARPDLQRAELPRDSATPAITVVTNALNIATEMVLRPHVRTVTLGGIARPGSYELVGPLAALVLEELWLDVLVLGVDGFDAVAGATCRHGGEAGIDAHMVRRARTVHGGRRLGEARPAHLRPDLPGGRRCTPWSPTRTPTRTGSPRSPPPASGAPRLTRRPRPVRSAASASSSSLVTVRQFRTVASVDFGRVRASASLLRPIPSGRNR